MGASHQVGEEGGGGGLAVRPGDAEGLVPTGHLPEELGPLDLWYVVLPVVGPQSIVLMDGGRVDDCQAWLIRTEGLRQQRWIVIVEDLRSERLQAIGDRLPHVVVPPYGVAVVEEVLGEGTHADAPDTDEEDGS